MQILRVPKDKRTEENTGIEIGTPVVNSLRRVIGEQINKGSATLIDMVERCKAYPRNLI